jgi:hypothetical protein
VIAINAASNFGTRQAAKNSFAARIALWQAVVRLELEQHLN